MPSRCFLEGTANCRLRNVSETTTSPSSFHETPTMGTHSGNTSPSSPSSLISLYISPPMMFINDYKVSDTENKETNTTPKRNNKSTRVFPQRGNSVGCCLSDEFMNSEFVKGDNNFFGRGKKREPSEATAFPLPPTMVTVTVSERRSTLFRPPLRVCESLETSRDELLRRDAV